MGSKEIAVTAAIVGTLGGAAMAEAAPNKHHEQGKGRASHGEHHEVGGIQGGISKALEIANTTTPRDESTGTQYDGPYAISYKKHNLGLAVHVVYKGGGQEVVKDVLLTVKGTKTDQNGNIRDVYGIGGDLSQMPDAKFN
jgi:hypothetical protein